MLTLRSYASDDLDALYSICLQTGDAGRDASHLHNEPLMLGHVYAAPYGVLEPHNVFVAEDEGGVAGYVVGTHDSDAFSERLEKEWWPALRERYADTSGLTATDLRRLENIRNPQPAPRNLVGPYPAHIHMNLLPRLRGQGVGSRLLTLWIDHARASGVKGIHLGASLANEGGIAFWSRSGFETISRQGAAWFGMTL